MLPLIRFGLRHSVLMNLLFIGLTAYALLAAFPRLAVDRFPNFSFGEVTIVTAWPGAAPEDVERLVTLRLEDALRGMEHLEYVRGESVRGRSLLHVKFEDDTAYQRLYDELRLRILGVQNSLPSADGEPLAPVVRQIETDFMMPVAQVNLRSAPGGLDERALLLLGRELRNRLEALPGVKSADLLNDLPQRLVVALDRDALQRHGIALAEVVQALRARHLGLPGGLLATAVGERQVQVDSHLRSRDEVLATPVRRDGAGALVTVADLCDLAGTAVAPYEGGTRLNVDGRSAVSLRVAKDSAASAYTVRSAVQAELDRFLTVHRQRGVDGTITLDSTQRIDDALSALSSNLYQAVVLVMLALVLFLGHCRRPAAVAVTVLGLGAAVAGALTQHWGVLGALLAVFSLLVFRLSRSALLITAGVVFAFLGSIAFFQATGRSMNEISLLGFVLVCGMLVDDAIVVTESIQRRRELGDPIGPACERGVSAVFWPVVSASATTIAAFLPLLLMSGVVGEFFSIIPIAVAVALGLSVIECLLMLPVHAVDLERLVGPEPVHRAEDPDLAGILARPGLVGRLGRLYDRLLSWNLDHPRLVLAGIGLLTALAAGILVQSRLAPTLDPPQRPILKSRFFPDDPAILNVSVRLPPGSTLEQTDAAMRELAELVLALGPSEIAACTGLAGLDIDESYRQDLFPRFGFAWVELPRRGERRRDSAALIADLRQRLAERFAPRGIATAVRAQPDGPPVGAAVNVRLGGLDDAAVSAAVDDLTAWLRRESLPGGRLAGVIDLRTDRDEAVDTLVFTPDPERLTRHGVPVSLAEETVAGAVDGLYAGRLLRTDDDIPVVVRFARRDLADPAGLLDLPALQAPGGGLLQVSDLGTLRQVRGPAQFGRRDFQRSVTLSANLAETAVIDAGHVNTLVAGWWAEAAPRHPGVALAFGGEVESTGRSYASLAVAFGVALFLIYTILAIQFNSYLQPLLILTNVLFAYIGIVLVLGVFAAALALLPAGWVRPERSLITVHSFIAAIGLAGLVINDAIVLIDVINRRRAEGLPLRHVLRLAGHERMRAVLMTSITTIAGLLSMAVGLPEFSIQWGPFATTFIAGLIASTLMTLLTVPVLYELLDGTIAGLRRRLRRPAQEAA